MVADFFEPLHQLGGEIAFDPHMCIFFIDAKVSCKQCEGLFFVDLLPAVEKIHCFVHFTLLVPLDTLKKLYQHFFVLLLAVAESPDHELVFL